MMNGQEKSDSGVVAAKPANKGGEPSAERVEPRPETKGNVGQQSTHRAQDRARVTQALDRVRKAARLRKKAQFTASPSHKCRYAQDGFPRAQAQSGSRRGWRDVAGLRGGP